jgi:nucleotide-binding universal stress UspA family protein
MFTHVLLPTDGSALSEAAIERGVRFAKELGARITAICAVPELQFFTYETEIPKEVKEKSRKQSRERAEQYLAWAARKAQEHGVPCETLCATDDQPHAAIIKAAEEKGCDLIMMASHGRKGVRGLLIGSETQKVLTLSRIPVLVYR